MWHYTRTIRLALGDGYLEAIRGVYPDAADHCDYVMYWWEKAAELVDDGKLRRFGLITTNSIRQSFSRKVLQKHMSGHSPMSLAFAIPDHPWVDSSDGAAVRVAMTVGARDVTTGCLVEVERERPGADGERSVVFRSREGRITAGLRVGVDLSHLQELRANSDLSCVGYQLTGKGFVVDQSAAALLEPVDEATVSLVRPLLSGRDITQLGRGLFAIDAFGLTEMRLRSEHPEIYQWIRDRVKPERDHNNRASLRRDWWIFGEARSTFRPVLKNIRSAVVTSLTAKHRFFIQTEPRTICDSTTVMFALEDAVYLGVLSSRIHVAWALATGGRLGVGNDPRYNKTRCFETFPFPEPNETQRSRIRDLAEQLDARRKHRQQLHPKLTLTGIYNVLEKLRTGEQLNDKEKEIHEQSLVTVLGELHDELDEAVLETYGWSDLGPALIGKPGGATPSAHKSPEQIEAEETLLERLVQLNAERAAEEEQGVIRWLRPEFQSPEGPAAKQKALIVGAAPDEAAAKRIAKRSWPKSLPDQVKALRAALAEQPGPVRPEQIARSFKRAQTKKVTELLETLAALGQARVTEDNRFAGN